MLTIPWTPDSTFKFPRTTKRNLCFQIKWLDEFKWLVYSDILKGAMCKYCTFFGKKGVGTGSHVVSVALTANGYHSWKDALTYFRDHGCIQYHKDAVSSAEQFISIYKKKTTNILEQLDRSIIRRNEEREKGYYLFRKNDFYN